MAFAISSSCNLFITTGRQILGLRHCFDFGHYRTGSPDQLHEANMSFLSMWFTTGRDYGLHDGEWHLRVLKAEELAALPCR